MPVTAPVVVTIVHSPACHYCDDARRALAELETRYPLTVDLVPADGQRGQALLAAHRPALFPLVLVGGALFSVGRLPRKKLRTLLDARVVAAVA